MNFFNKYKGYTVLHFNKWSNTSYAIFNSIGRIIHVGFLSQIIHGLVTVKTIKADGFLEGINDFIAKDEFDEDQFNQIEFIELIKSNQLASCLSTTVLNDNSTKPIEIFTHAIYIILNKAFFGPFLIAQIFSTQGKFENFNIKMVVNQLKIWK